MCSSWNFLLLVLSYQNLISFILIYKWKRLNINCKTINIHVILWERFYFFGYHQKFYCSFQQTQTANFKVSTSTVLQNAVPCLLTDGSVIKWLIVSIYVPVRKLYQISILLFALSRWTDLIYRDLKGS